MRNRSLIVYAFRVSNPPRSGISTLQDLLAIPEEHRRHELIDGVLVEKEAASGRHGGAQLAFGQVLRAFFRPDVAGWRREHLAELPAEVPIRTRPDWICEVLSTNRRNDLVKKKRSYHLHHVDHYWLLDPVDETLAVHRWHPDGYVEVLSAERHERGRAEPFDTIELHVAVLFGEDEADE
jgi:Uma2 family endonuclease